MPSDTTAMRDELAKAKSIIRSLDRKHTQLLNHEKATAEYWNGDDWGGISGIRDADEWVATELAKHLMKQLAARKAMKGR